MGRRERKWEGKFYRQGLEMAFFFSLNKVKNGPDRTVIEGAKNSVFWSARALWNTSVLSFVRSFVCPQEKSDHL